MTRVMVTGVAGFIGSHLCDRLIADGIEVRGIDRFSDYYEPDLKRANIADAASNDRFELVEGALADLDLPALLDDVEIVYHLAAQPGVRPSWGREFNTYVEDNVLGTQVLLEAAREASLGRIVYASSSSVYGDAERFPTSEDDTPRPVSPYGVTKLAAEHLCDLYTKSFGVPTVSVRYFTIFGPRQRPDMAFNRFIEATLDHRPIEVFGDGEQSRDFTYVADAVTATIAAATAGTPGRAYNVAGGNQATVREVIELLGRLADTEIAVEYLERVAGDAIRTGADTSRARADLSYSPTVTLEDGLGRQLEAQRERR